MEKINLNLLPKQLAFIERALENQIIDFENKISSGDCSEDEISDMQNDLILMKPTLEDLRKAKPS
ncbi:MAG: hypothetical protein Q4G28_09885 [Neisseria sp.]|nr:hypothetical protein [Neisseria sp.]